ncbi:MAG: 3-octaprenyl-4-hydroxybenzoate carboxy-lyase [Flavobacteriales bacterium]|nr:3-octaprenyl-4-hydroxybenzoate carboxy-lyase [Flavobacteriales bacterium]
MKKEKKNIIIAVTGASGSIYAKVLFDKLIILKEQINNVGILISDNAKTVWKTELGDSSYKDYPFKFYNKLDFMAPFASGSSNYTSMIICPCSMGTLGRIASGISNDLTTRAADVVLKERRKLVIVARETPYNLIHIENMKKITEAGGIICPATPSFYSNPKTFNELALTVVDRVINLIELENNAYKWGDKHNK